MGRIWGAAVACAAGGLWTGAVSAQSTSEATIYSRGHFQGQSVSFTGPITRINPPFIAKSVQIAPGTAWELCSGNTFTGCRRIDKSVEAGVVTIRSARPIPPVITGSAVPGVGPGVSPVAGVNTSNQSLRGFASEFFVAPGSGGQRISLPDNKPESMRRIADEFCRSAGWRMSIHARLQNIGGSYYLADVLCSNDAG